MVRVIYLSGKRNPPAHNGIFSQMAYHTLIMFRLTLWYIHSVLQECKSCSVFLPVSNVEIQDLESYKLSSIWVSMADDILNIRRKEYKHEIYKYSFYPESVIRKFEFGRAKKCRHPQWVNNDNVPVYGTVWTVQWLFKINTNTECEVENRFDIGKRFFFLKAWFE